MLTVLAAFAPASAGSAGLPPTLVPDEIVLVHTADGWVEPLRRYRGDGPPVLLVHGMSANHYNFDYRDEISLADALRDAGWDVWVVSLRGDEGTAAPSRRAARSISFDDYAEGDVPAVIDEVRARTGVERVYWVGHSLGGMLLYATLARDPDAIAAGVAIASPAVFTEQPPRAVLAAAVELVGERGNLPTPALARLSLPLGLRNPEFQRVANTANLDWPTAKGLARHALSDIPKPLAHQALTWVETGRLVARDGRDWLAPADVPVLVMGSPADRVVPGGDVRAACDVLPDCAWVELSRAAGFSVDYGHADATIGRSARAEVYPVVIGFLDANR